MTKAAAFIFALVILASCGAASTYDYKSGRFRSTEEMQREQHMVNRSVDRDIEELRERVTKLERRLDGHGVQNR